MSTDIGNVLSLKFQFMLAFCIMFNILFWEEPHLHMKDPVGNGMAEQNNSSSIQEVLNMEYLTQFGREGKGDGEFVGPFGIHVSHEGLIYVAVDLNHVNKTNAEKDEIDSYKGKKSSKRLLYPYLSTSLMLFMILGIYNPLLITSISQCKILSEKC